METAEGTHEGQEQAWRERPQEQHAWLQQLVGEWTFEHEAPSSGGGGSFTGTESVRSFGELWILGEGHGEFDTLMTLGFHPATGRFVGTWIGSMMTHLWVYDGELDAERGVLTLNAEGPSMSGDGTTAQYQDIIELKSPDHRILSSRMKTPDGDWQHFMTVHYRRTG